MPAASLFASIVFGSIGFAAFIYGKKQSRLRLLVIGIALMIYPYFVPDPKFSFAIGAALIIGIFFPR